MVIAGVFSAQLGCLAENKREVEGRFYVSAKRTDNVYHFILVCSDRRLFSANTNFCHESDIGSLGVVVFLHNAGLRLTALSSVSGGVDHLSIAIHSGLHS